MTQMRENLGKRIEIRAWGNDLSRWQAASHKAGYRSVSEWIRRTLNDEVAWSSFDRRHRTRFENSLRNAVDELTAPVYDRTILDNGITIVTESIPAARSISIGIVVACGTREEGPGEKGLAALCAHLLFDGTSRRDRGAIARQIDNAGSQTGAFTCRDYSCLYSTVLEDYSFHALDLLGDMLLNSVFPEDAVEYEKRVVRRELEVQDDEPSHRLAEILKQFLWYAEPSQKQAPGAQSAFARFTREDAIAFVHRNYTPNRMIVAAAGSVRHEEFVAQSRDIFWQLAGASEPSPEQPPRVNPGLTIHLQGLRRAYFALGLPAPSCGHPDRYALDILARLLGSGMSSRLSRSLQEGRVLVQNVRADYSAYRDAGLLSITGNVEPFELQNSITRLLDCVWSLLSGSSPAQEEELLLAKTQLRSEYLLAGENLRTRMSCLATQQLYFQMYFPTKDILQAIDLVNVETVKRLAGTVLADGLAQSGLAILGSEQALEGRDELRRLLSGFQERCRSWKIRQGAGAEKQRATGAAVGDL